MKRTGALLFSLILALGVVFSSPVLVSAAAEQENFEIRIVHTNDIHARVAETESSGIIGAARLKTMIDTWNSGGDLGLVLDSGDLFHGQPIATLVQGASVAELVEELGYDAMTAGNHDWNYGKDRLKELSKMSGLAMLTGNVVDERGEMFFEDPYLIKEVSKNGKTLKIGLFGVIDPRIYSSTAPRNVQGLTFTDPSGYANRAAADLRNQGCDVVIALTHTYDPKGLAETVNGVDLWLAGHEHLQIDEEVKTPDGSETYVMEDGLYLYTVGLIEMNVTVDPSRKVSKISCGRQSVNYSEAKTYAPDQKTEALLLNIQESQSGILDQVVGKTPVELDGVWEHVRIGETNLGRVVADAYLLETGADVAFENAGGIRASVAAGDVTYGDIIGVSPFGNYIVTKQITGKALREMMEISIDLQIRSAWANANDKWEAWPENSGSFLQTGGMKITYNPAEKKGNRILEMWIGGEKLQEDRLYTVASNNFVAISEDYPMLAKAKETGQFAACDEALVRFFGQGEEAVAASAAEKRLIAANSLPEQIPGEDQAKEQEPDSAQEVTSPKTGEENSLWIVGVLVMSAAAGTLLAGKKKSA